MEVPDVIREANEKEIEFAQSENPLSKQAEVTNELLKSARGVSKTDIQTFEQLCKFVLENPEKEPEITEILKSSGYLEMWKWDIERNPWHYDVDKFKEHYKDSFSRTKSALYWATTEKETRERYEITLKTVEFGYSFYRQEFFDLQIKLYEKLIDLSKQREKVGLAILDK